MKQLDKYQKLINESYKEDIIEDLNSGRHISATICGYGATFTNDYKLFYNALKSFDWFNELYSEDKNGRM